MFAQSACRFCEQLQRIGYKDFRKCFQRNIAAHILSNFSSQTATRKELIKEAKFQRLYKSKFIMHESAGYPSSSTKLPKDVCEKLFDFPGDDNKKINLEWLQENVWKDVENFEISDEDIICGMQANIYKIVLKSVSKNECRKIVAKRLVPKELPPKANKELWVDFLKSVESEVGFYRDLSLANPDLFPKVYYSDGKTNTTDIMDSFYLILMEDVSKDYFQDTGMNKSQAENLMKTLAKFHATHWKKIDPKADRGTFWVLERRQILGEIESADEIWKAVLQRFPEFQNLYPGVENLGSQIASKAQKMDDFIASNLLTQVHGDCKGWNLFFIKEELSKQSEKSPVLMIDLQWTGIGHPLQDVAYALTTTLQPELLPEMDYFVDFYIENLSKHIADLDPKALKNEFDIVWLDYARVILTGLWKRFSPESIVKNQCIVGPSYVARSKVHAEFIIRKANDLLNVNPIVI